MIEERAIVQSVIDGAVLIRPISPANCPRCAEGRGCGGGLLSRLAGPRRQFLSAEPASRMVPPLRAGEVVVVGLDESALVQASLLLWLAPLGAMVAAGVFADRLLDATDILVAAFGMVGLAAGFLWVRWRASGLDARRFRPRVLRRDPRPAASCARLS